VILELMGVVQMRSARRKDSSGTMDFADHLLISPKPSRSVAAASVRWIEDANTRRLMRSGLATLLLSLAGLPFCAGHAAAQDPARPLEFEVRPSGVVAETPEEALDRRLRQREYLFQSICIQCSRSDRFSSNTPFNPLEALARTGRN